MTETIGTQVINASATDSLTFSSNGMIETVSGYSDTACSQPLATVTATYSSVVVGDNDPNVSGATELTVVVGSIQITPLAAAEITALLTEGCASNWSIGVSQDVTGTSSCGMEAAGTSLYQIFSLDTSASILSIGGSLAAVLNGPDFHDQAGNSPSALPTSLMLQTYARSP